MLRRLRAFLRLRRLRRRKVERLYAVMRRASYSLTEIKQ